MLKKALFIFLILFIGSKSFAQVELGVKAGLNLSKIEAIDIDIPNVNQFLAYHFGAYATVSMTDRFSVIAELLWSRKGWVDNSNRFNTEIDYLSLPLMVELNPIENFGVQLGIETSYLILDYSLGIVMRS